MIKLGLVTLLLLTSQLLFGINVNGETKEQACNGAKWIANAVNKDVAIDQCQCYPPGDHNRNTAGMLKDDISQWSCTVNAIYTHKVIWVDEETNLMWQDNEDTKRVLKDWEGAKDYCENLTLAGRGDWYLPTKDELNTLYSKKEALKNVASNYYWSSSPVVADSAIAWVVDDPTLAWNVYFGNGNMYRGRKNSELNIRCVRDSK